MVATLGGQAALLVGYVFFSALRYDDRFGIPITLAVLSAPFIVLLVLVGRRACVALLRAGRAFLRQPASRRQPARDAAAWLALGAIPMQAAWTILLCLASFNRPNNVEVFFACGVGVLAASVAEAIFVRAAA
jgi:hypothetical protein